MHSRKAYSSALRWSRVVVFGFFCFVSVPAFAAGPFAAFLSPAGDLGAGSDPYQGFFQSVDQDSLWATLRELTGDLPVTVSGETFRITNRYSPEAKAAFRKFWLDYYRKLGADVREIAYPTQHQIGETMGHDVEAVFPGRSKDSVVIIVHYDSIGPDGQETQNPGVDDDMSGMAIQMETARLLASVGGELDRTVRFVGADYEEQAFPGLEGARKYAAELKEKAQTEGFQIVAAIDNEQSGWNCAKEGACADGRVGPTFDVFSCAPGNQYSYPAIGDALSQVAAQYSKLQTNRDCIGENSDHYAFWEIGVPAVVFSEHEPFNNPHFDQEGGDTIDKIDRDYFFKIAQVGATFAAKTIGLGSN